DPGEVLLVLGDDRRVDGHRYQVGGGAAAFANDQRHPPARLGELGDDPFRERPVGSLGRHPRNVQGPAGSGDGAIGEALGLGQAGGVEHVMTCHRPVHLGVSPALNARWNAAWSPQVMSSAWAKASSAIAEPRSMSSSLLMRTLVAAWAVAGPSASRRAIASASTARSASGTTLLARPIRSASAASIGSPKRRIKIGRAHV